MTLSRQRQWQVKKRREGRCQQCGSVRDCGSVSHCSKCLRKQRTRDRKQRGGKVRVYRCGECGGAGHNVRTCKENMR